MGVVGEGRVESWERGSKEEWVKKSGDEGEMGGGGSDDGGVMMVEERAFLAGFGGAKAGVRLFRAGASRPTARGLESCSGRPRSAIIGKSASRFRVWLRQTPQEKPWCHVLRTAGRGRENHGGSSGPALPKTGAGEREEKPWCHVLRTAGRGQGARGMKIA